MSGHSAIGHHASNRDRPFRIVIAYATAGAGHRRAAEALSRAVTARWPQARVACVDILAYTPRWFHAGYAWSYLFLVQHAPWIWRLSYGLLDSGWVLRCAQPARRLWNRVIARRFSAWLRREPPDLIVAAHFFPADVCRTGRRAGWLTAPVVVVVTDWHPHRFWLAPEFSAVVVGSPEAAAVCRARGLRPDQLHIQGIPIGREPHPQAGHDPAARFQLAAGRRTVLVTSGGTTVGPFERVVAALTDLERTSPGALQLLVICGDSAAAVERLRGLARQREMPVSVFGLIEDMPEAMRAAAFVVTKAGGMTLAEALGHGLPIVIYHAIPGQEARNAQYLVERGAAVIAQAPEEVAGVIRRWLEDPQALAAVRRAAASLSRPDAAEEIVAKVLEPLLTR